MALPVWYNVVVTGQMSHVVSGATANENFTPGPSPVRRREDAAPHPLQGGGQG